MSKWENDNGCTNVGFNLPDKSNMDQAPSSFSTSDVVSEFDGQLLLMSETNQSSSEIVSSNPATTGNISQAKHEVYLRVKRLCILAHKALELYKMVHTYNGHKIGRHSIRLPGKGSLKNSSPKDLLKIRKLIFVLKRSIYALTFDKSIMIRSLYYESNLFNNQKQSNEIIKILSIYTEIPRYHLRFVAGSRGHVYHPYLQYKTRHDNGFITPANGCLDISDTLIFDGIEFNICNCPDNAAVDILIIEKETFFFKLVHDISQSTLLQNVICVTGQGMPTFAVRQAVQSLREQIKVNNTYICVDYNPDAIYIMINYMRECQTMKLCGMSSSYNKAKLLSLTHSQVKRLLKYETGSYYGKNFSELDQKKLKNLEQNPFVMQHPLLLRHVQYMQQTGISVELDQIDPSCFGFNSRSIVDFLNSCMVYYNSEMHTLNS